MSPVPEIAKHMPWMTEVVAYHGDPIAHQPKQLATDKQTGLHTYERWLFKVNDATRSIMLLRYSDACWYVKITGTGRRHVDYRHDSEPGAEVIRQALTLAGWLPAAPDDTVCAVHPDAEALLWNSKGDGFCGACIGRSGGSTTIYHGVGHGAE